MKRGLIDLQGWAGPSAAPPCNESLTDGKRSPLALVQQEITPALSPSRARLDLTDEGPTGADGSDSRMRDLHRTADRVAAGTISVLITGETGVGKEILAQRIHERSPRRDKPLLALSCGALPEHLLESELFGHERGAFTGAVGAKEGLFETVQGGTLFLDEVGEMSLALQSKLLRVLETRQLFRVGATKARSFDARIIAATNRDLSHEMRQGTFRGDLFYRLAGIVLPVPPLRERRGEIEPLAKWFVGAAAREQGIVAPQLPREVLELLRRYEWPGNVRELRNAMGRVVLLAGDGWVHPDHLPPEILAASEDRCSSPSNFRDRVERFERDEIVGALACCGGSRVRAAELLGLSRSTLYEKLKAYQIG